MTITLADVWQAAGLVLALGGIWWRMHLRIEAIAHALDAYKLEVAEKYASVEHLKEVEARLVISMDRLTNRIDRLLGRFDELRGDVRK